MRIVFMRIVFKGTIAAVALLFVLTGCINNDIPFREAFTITVMDNVGTVIPDNSNVFFNAGAPYKLFSVFISGDEVISAYNWEIVKGEGIVAVNPDGAIANMATVAPLSPGDAKIRVTAVSSGATARAEFNVYVNPSGYGPWTFKMLDGTTEIYDTDRIIHRSGEKTVTLKPVPDNESMSFTSAITYGDCVTINQTGSAITISVVKNGVATLEITAANNAQTITKRITVYVGDPDILLSWNSTDLPLGGSHAAGTVIDSGYNGIYFGKRSSAFVFDEGAIKQGGESIHSRLTVGTGSETGLAYIIGPTGGGPTATFHPAGGQFDLSRGTFRLTLEYRDAAASENTNDPVLRIYLNNTSDGASSVLGGNSGGMGDDMLGAFGLVERIETGTSYPDLSAQGVTVTGTKGKLIVTMTPSIRYARLAETFPAYYNSLKTAYITFMTAAGARFTITGIQLQRLPD